MGCKSSKEAAARGKGAVMTTTVTLTADASSSSATEISSLRQLSVVEGQLATTAAQPRLYRLPVGAANAAVAANATAAVPPPQASASGRSEAPAAPMVSSLSQQLQLHRSLSADSAGAAPAPPGKAAAAAAAQDAPLSRFVHSVASLSRAGRDPRARKTNQDACITFEKYLADSQGLFAALDGHGPHGHLASAFLRQHMPVALVERLAVVEAEAAAAAGKQQQQQQQQPSWRRHQRGEGGPAARALTAAFQDSDEALCRAVDCQFSGAAVVACLLQGRHLTTAWLGDCRAVLARADTRGSLKSIPLTHDHKPANLEERARIVAAGGRVEPLTDSRGQPLGPPRVWLGDSWVPGLAMSRALGDVVAHSAGVSSIPDTFQIDITLQDRFLILATDGVWEFIDCELAVEIIDGSATAEEACRRLVSTAWNRWTREEDIVDDISVVVVKFKASGDQA